MLGIQKACLGHNQIIVCPSPQQPHPFRETEPEATTPCHFFPYWMSPEEVLQVTSYPVLLPFSWALSMHPRWECRLGLDMMPLR